MMTMMMISMTSAHKSKANKLSYQSVLKVLVHQMDPVDRSIL